MLAGIKYGMNCFARASTQIPLPLPRRGLSMAAREVNLHPQRDAPGAQKQRLVHDR